MIGSTALEQRKTLVRFEARTDCHSSSSMSSVERITAKPPALLTRISSRPQRAITASSARPMSAERVTSARSAWTSAPRFRSASATASTPAPSRSSAATRAPSRAQASTMATPMPFAAPVIMATFPSSRTRDPLSLDRVDSIHAVPVLVLGAEEGDRMGRFVDLSVTVDSSTMSPPSTNMRLEVTPHNRGPGFWQVSSVHQSLHTGAHIDSPLHVFKNGITTAEITLDQVMGEALVVDLSWAGPNHAISIDDLKKGGAEDVKRGDIVLLRTGWTDTMYGKWPDYLTQSPYFPPETAQWLVDRGPKNIGFDFFEEYCARLADFTSEDFAMHRVILGAGVVIMEGLTNLGALPRRRVDFAAPFYKIAGTEGAPARFFATV